MRVKQIDKKYIANPYNVTCIFDDADNGWIIVEDEETGLKIKVYAQPIVDYFRDNKVYAFDQTAEGYYICPVCGAYYDEDELSEHAYCKNCGVALEER